MSSHADLTARWCGSGTALSVQDVLFRQTTATGPQRFAGRRSPRRTRTSPIRTSAPRRRLITLLLVANQAAAAPQRIVTPDLRLVLWRHIKVER